jgi:adenylate cyclase
MAVEIERKFLVTSEAWRADVVGRKLLRQAYLAREGKSSIRVRMVDDASASITIKSRGARVSRLEFEYPIPADEARTLLELREGYLLSKVRHLVRHGDLTWEIDVFTGDNAGLIIAEVELDHERQDFVLPPWVGREITHEERYYNSNLAIRPYRLFAADGTTEHRAG